VRIIRTIQMARLLKRPEVLADVLNSTENVELECEV
jgi:hypothetical protein